MSTKTGRAGKAKEREQEGGRTGYREYRVRGGRTPGGERKGKGKGRREHRVLEVPQLEAGKQKGRGKEKKTKARGRREDKVLEVPRSRR